jgi:hypothetical protein
MGKAMKLMCYPVRDTPTQMVPGKPERDWMDEAPNRAPYRCLPLVVANTSGWELLVPSPIKATWNGGPRQSDLVIESPFTLPPNTHRPFANSHFGVGVLTFYPGYLFRTPPGWDLWVSGPPNTLKHGVQALSGVVETSWSAHPFTMNWRFTAPGTISFAAGEPFCFIMPIPHTAVDECEPVIKQLADDPELEQQTKTALQSREAYIQGMREGVETSADGWQRNYFKGQHATGERGTQDHIHRRRLKPPRPAGAGD